MSLITTIAHNLRFILTRRITDYLGEIGILRGDNSFALARKTSSPIERNPKELYVH